MGLIDNIRKFFLNSKNTQTVQVQAQTNSEYEKSRLADQIVSLVNSIKRIDSYDSTVWNLSNISSYELRRKNLAELEKLHSRLENRLEELNRQSQQRNPRREALEASKWTGQKPKDMSDHDFDRFQRDDDR